jgi:hypothetical protein
MLITRLPRGRGGVGCELQDAAIWSTYHSGIHQLCRPPTLTRCTCALLEAEQHLAAQLAG